MSRGNDVLTQKSQSSRKGRACSERSTSCVFIREQRFFFAVFAAFAVFVVFLTVPRVRAQTLPTAIPQTKFASGQDIVPYFEGWIRNADGTFDMVFGYFNRNWQEELTIPAG